MGQSPDDLVGHAADVMTLDVHVMGAGDADQRDYRQQQY